MIGVGERSFTNFDNRANFEGGITYNMMYDYLNDGQVNKKP
jgi:hypothetical protein